jgi:drug/metabolite transporter (DMT)-like permease
MTHAALFVVQLAFASQTVEGKIAMRSVEAGGGGVAPVALAMARMLGGAAFFFAATRAMGIRPALTKRDHLQLAGLAVIGIALNQTLFLMGLRLTSPISAALLAVTIPVFTAVMAVALGRERPTVRTFGGLFIALAGVLWLTGVKSIDRGAALVTLNSVFYSLYLVSAGPVIRRLGPLTVITWVFVWASLMFAPFGIPALVQGAQTWTPRGWFFVGFIVAVPTIIAYSLNAYALGRTSPIIVTVYIYCQPVIAGLLAWAQLGVVPEPKMLGAAVLILLGVTIVAFRGAATSAAR